MTIMMEGKSLSKQIIKNVKQKIADNNFKLSLKIIMIGEDPASKIYVKHKLRVCEQVGIDGELIKLNQDITLAELKDVITKLNLDSQTTGFLIQLPLSKKLQKYQSDILNMINPAKDVDGLSGANTLLRINNKGGLIPATPLGILELMNYYKFSLKNKFVALLGQGIVVGKPMAIELKNMNVDYICLDKNSGDLKIKESLKKADVIISSTGVRHLLNNKAQVKKNVILIDVGITQGKDNKISGDIKTQEFLGYAQAITPVPGGIGPMTVASLIQNLIFLKMM